MESWIIEIVYAEWVGREEAKLQHAMFGSDSVTSRKHEPIREINEMNGGCATCGI
jgi:hypothetical protein